MNRNEAVERAVGYTDEGFLCVEAVFKTLADMHGTDSDLIPSARATRWARSNSASVSESFLPS